MIKIFSWVEAPKLKSGNLEENSKAQNIRQIGVIWLGLNASPSILIHQN